MHYQPWRGACDRKKWPPSCKCQQWMGTGYDLLAQFSRGMVGGVLYMERNLKSYPKLIYSMRPLSCYEGADLPKA